MKFAEIVVNVPLAFPSSALAREGEGEGESGPYAWLDQTFTYNVPAALRSALGIGQMVWVPFGARRLQGLVVGLGDTTWVAETRPVEAIVETQPLLSPAQIELARWISRRYLAPFAECVWLLLPPGIEEKVETIYTLGPSTHEANGLTEKHKHVLELVAAARDLKSTRLPPNLRGAAESLVHSGYLSKSAQVKPARAKPKRVQSVRLIAAPDQVERVLPTLVRRDLSAEIIQTLSGSNRPILVDELCRRVGCAPAAVRALAKKGIVELSPRGTAFSLTQKYFQDPPALAPTAARVLVYLREQGKPALYQDIYDATKATPAILRTLEVQGYIGHVEQGELVLLVSLPTVVPPASRLAQIAEFLKREPNPVWISAVYAATGANRQDLQKLEAAGLITLESEVQIRDPLAGREFEAQTPPRLTTEQAEAFAAIQRGLESGGPSVYLLHGVTGSGKTEIYLRAIEHVLKQDKQAIALVPEIALTPQTIQRFGARFGQALGVIHSELSPGERYDTWRRARDGMLDVIIGPRSALFAPLPRLGLIVVDEEHEPSYKQEPDIGLHLPLYHAREVALELGRLNNATVILGSATPDVETYWRTRGGEFTLLELPQRILAHGPGNEAVQYQDLPPVQVVDLRVELREHNTSVFSRALAGAMRETLAAHEQAILFLNRRGTATSVLCRDCGQALKCPRCNTPYTLHQFGGQAAAELVCHHCGKHGQVPRLCPNCSSTRIRALGLGTEKLEQIVREMFPKARTLRWDWDMTRKEPHEKLLEAFTRGDADVLIGTQMIAKGLDLPRVTLVGVVNADTALNLPDFRSSERTFQLLTQVGGRAGRSALGGRVIIQTYYPEHYAITSAAGHDYARFYERELLFRKEAGYPPFSPLVRLIFSGESDAQARMASEKLAATFEDRIRRRGAMDIQVIGPAPAFFAKLGGRYRYHLLLRGHAARDLLATLPLPTGWRVDVDPVNLL